MSIIASILLAASYTFKPSDFVESQKTATLEYNEIGQTETVMTNEPWCTIIENNSDCYVRMTVTEYTNLTHRLSVLWAERNERLANIEKRKAMNKERQPAIERVKENAAKRKRRSMMSKSLPTGGSKK